MRCDFQVQLVHGYVNYLIECNCSGWPSFGCWLLKQGTFKITAKQTAKWCLNNNKLRAWNNCHTHSILVHAKNKKSNRNRNRKFKMQMHQPKNLSKNQQQKYEQKNWIKINKRISECWKMCNCGWLSMYVGVCVYVCDNKNNRELSISCVWNHEKLTQHQSATKWQHHKYHTHTHTYEQAMTFPWLTFDSSAQQLCCSFVRCSIPFSYSCATCCMSLAYLSAILILPQYQSKYIFSTPISHCCRCCCSCDTLK